MPPPARTIDADVNSQSTAITSPLRRIPSFIEDEDEEELNPSISITKSPVRTNGNNSTKSSPGTSTVNKKKRNHHSEEIQENELGPQNRSQEEQSQRKRMMGQESSGSPLRKKSSKQIQSLSSEFGSSWGSRLRKARQVLNEHRRNSDFEAWSRELWHLGSWWLEVSGEEAAGIVFDLIEEFKREHAQFKNLLVIPLVCDNLFLDKLQAKALMLMGKNEEALEVCTLTLKNNCGSGSQEIEMEIRFLAGCLSRTLGKISSAIEYFESVLNFDPSHAEAHDHLYGATCGLLPFKARSSEEGALNQAFSRGNYKRVIDLTRDGFWTRWLGDESVMILLASSLACNFDASALYTLGQRSVNQRPDASVSWYCVGLFYQVTGRSDEARRYLFKAGIGSKIKKFSGPDVGIGPAWIALGHSFAAYGDHDQAVSAYVAAVKTHCPGSVDPSLFLAIEYLRVRQPVLAAAYLLDAHNADPNNPRVLNELACLQAGKDNMGTAKKFLLKALELADLNFPPSFRIAIVLNLCIVSVKEAMRDSRANLGDMRKVLDECGESFVPLLSLVKKTIESENGTRNSSSSALSLFPWTANSAHPSAEHSFLFTYCVIQEWRALLLSASNADGAVKLTEDALEGYRALLECRNEHRNLAMEPVLIERQHRLLSAHSTLSIKLSEGTAYKVPLKPADESFTGSRSNPFLNAQNANFKTPRTPLIRSHSLAMMDSFSSSSGSNLSFISGAQTPTMSFSAGALPSVAALGLTSAGSSIAASVSRRRLSLRRQMTGLRFDPADTSASFSSLESDNSFMSTTSGPAMVTSTQINEDLMMTSGLIVNQSMILIEGTDVEADCEFIDGRRSANLIEDEEDMQLDSE